MASDDGTLGDEARIFIWAPQGRQVKAPVKADVV